MSPGRTEGPISRTIELMAGLAVVTSAAPKPADGRATGGWEQTQRPLSPGGLSAPWFERLRRMKRKAAISSPGRPEVCPAVHTRRRA